MSDPTESAARPADLKAAEPPASKPARKRKPLWLRLLLGFVVFLVVLLFAVQYALGPVVKTAAETVGPMVLKTPVAVSNAHMRVLSGVVDFKGMVVGAPEGFDANVFEMQNFRVDLDVPSLFGATNEPIVVRDITIDSPFVTYELKGLKDNLHALLANLGVKDGDGGEEKAKEEKPEKGPGRKVVIEHFAFKNAKVRVAVVGGKGAVVPLPTIELKDIGKDSGGATAIDAVGQILKQITIGTVVAVKDVLMDLGGAAVDAVGAVGGAAVDAVGAVGGAAVDAAGRAAGAVTGAIGSLFGGAKEDDAK